jgi:hypothetical protein
MVSQFLTNRAEPYDFEEAANCSDRTWTEPSKRVRIAYQLLEP